MNHGRRQSTARRFVTLLLAVALITTGIALVAPMGTAAGLPGCSATGTEDCDAYFYPPNILGTTTVSKRFVKPGDVVRITGTSNYPYPEWIYGVDAAGITSVTMSGPGTVIAYGPKANTNLSVSPSATSVTFTGIEHNAVGVGVPTASFPVGSQFWIDVKIPAGAHGPAAGQAMWTANRGSVGETVPSRRHIEIVTTAKLAVAGTLTATDCTDTACRRVAVAGDTVTLHGTAALGGTVSVTARSRADGTWSTKVPEGTYKASAGKDFAPSSRTLNVTAPIAGVDFVSCQSLTPGLRSYVVRADALAQNAHSSGCPDGIDWQMLSRLNTSTPRQTTTEDVYAPFSLDLTLTTAGNPVTACSDTSTWTWKVTRKPSGAKVLHEPGDGCRSFLQVSKLGTYHVVARRYAKATGVLRQTLQRDITVKDLLVIGIGDSNASGEGAGPFWDHQCDRGPASYQFQASHLLEKQSKGHASVTFLSEACSGARTIHLYASSYQGIHRYPAALPPQLTHVAHDLTPPDGLPRRKPDALIVSAGVNDLGFGPLLEFCIKQTTACEDETVKVSTDRFGNPHFTRSSAIGALTLRQALAQLTAALPARYDALASAISKSGLVPASKVYISQYPAFTYAAGGASCTTMAGFPLSASTWQWLGQAGADLNTQVADAAALHRWKLITVDPSYFYGHGYCTSDRWFTTLTDVALVNAAGAFHPTDRGAHVTAVLLLRELCSDLGEPKKCVTFPTP